MEEETRATARNSGGDMAMVEQRKRWVPDDESVACGGCGRGFTMTRRRHHCRRCGDVFCNACCCRRVLLLSPVSHSTEAPSKRSDPHRVCSACAVLLGPMQAELRSTLSNAVKRNSIDHSARHHVNSPLAFTLGHEIRKAAYTVASLLKETRNGAWTLANKDGEIPLRMLQRAKGLAFLTIAKAGFLLAGCLGTGLVIARLPDGRWSAPTAIAAGGVSAGYQVGINTTDFVFILMTDAAVEVFCGAQLSLGGEISVAVGTVGRTAQLEANVGSGGATGVYAYSLSRGVFAGVSGGCKVINSRPRTNQKFYGCHVSPADLVGGLIPPPPAAAPLYELLERACAAQGGPQQFSGAAELPVDATAL